MSNCIQVYANAACVELMPNVDWIEFVTPLVDALEQAAVNGFNATDCLDPSPRLSSCRLLLDALVNGGINPADLPGDITSEKASIIYNAVSAAVNIPGIRDRVDNLPEFPPFMPGNPFYQPPAPPVI